MVNGKYIFNRHWPNRLKQVEGFCTTYRQPLADLNPRPFALKATRLTTALRRLPAASLSVCSLVVISLLSRKSLLFNFTAISIGMCGVKRNWNISMSYRCFHNFFLLYNHLMEIIASFRTLKLFSTISAIDRPNAKWIPSCQDSQAFMSFKHSVFISSSTSPFQAVWTVWIEMSTSLSLVDNKGTVLRT